MIWAILMNRHKLAKTLWTKCDEPICIALISSMIYRELSKYSMEQFQKTEMEDNARYDRSYPMFQVRKGNRDN